MMGARQSSDDESNQMGTVSSRAFRFRIASIQAVCFPDLIAVQANLTIKESTDDERPVSSNPTTFFFFLLAAVSLPLKSSAE